MTDVYPTLSEQLANQATEQSIRERLARAAFGPSKVEWSFLKDSGKQRYLEMVDAILAELENPSEGIEGVMKAQWLEGANFSICFAAAIRHIRDGGK